MADPALLIQQLKAVVENPDTFSSHQHEIIQLSRKAAMALDGPFETFQRLAYSPLPLVTARVAQEHKIFQTLVENKDATVSVATLAHKSGIKRPVLRSLLEYLSTQHLVEKDSEEYKATKQSELFLSPLFIDGVTHFHDNCLPAFSALNYTISNPDDRRTAFEVGQHSSGGLYTWFETHPAQEGAFHRFMAMQFASLPTWLDVIPFEAEYGQSTDNETPLFVDVGGGNGQQCISLRDKYPALKGRVILQDRPPVLEKAITGPGIEKMSYDYLTEQPVKSARAYYFRQILHNNDDETCIQILKSQLPAMAESSVLLIDEKVLPNKKSPDASSGAEYTSGLDLAMVAMFNALERNETEWKKLLGDAGYNIQAIKKFTNFEDSVIVCVKKLK